MHPSHLNCINTLIALETIILPDKRFSYGNIFNRNNFPSSYSRIMNQNWWIKTFPQISTSWKCGSVTRDTEITLLWSVEKFVINYRLGSYSRTKVFRKTDSSTHTQTWYRSKQFPCMLFPVPKLQYPSSSKAFSICCCTFSAHPHGRVILMYRTCFYNDL